MADLISRAAAIDAIISETIYPDRETIDKVCGASPSMNNGWVGGIRDSINAVEEVNAVDAAPVVHGQWVKEADRTQHWHCSECGSVWGQAIHFMNYCPKCGARMDKEDV